MSDSGRDGLRMSTEEVAAFLAAGRRVQVATFDAAGGIHLVPMSYLFWDGAAGAVDRPGSQKVRNLRRNPAIACLVEEGTTFEEFRAVQLRGRAELIEDAAASRAGGRAALRPQPRRRGSPTTCGPRPRPWPASGSWSSSIPNGWCRGTTANFRVSARPKLGTEGRLWRNRHGGPRPRRGAKGALCQGLPDSTVVSARPPRSRSCVIELSSSRSPP